MFSVEEKRKRKTVYIKRTWTMCCVFLLYSDNFQCSKAENGTCNTTDFVMSLLGIIHQSFLFPYCTILHSSL